MAVGGMTMKQTIFDNLKSTFNRGDILIRLIFINVGLFLIAFLAGIFYMLFNQHIGNILTWFQLPADFTQLLIQPWSLFTYQFMHADLSHVFFNMLGLWLFGSIFLRFFSQKHLRGLYLFGGICGGLLFMISYNIFPYFSHQISETFLLGASASVFAIIIAITYQEPNYPVRLYFFGSVPLKYLTLAVIAITFLYQPISNIGGHISHLGGGLAGLWFAASLRKGADLTKWLNLVLDWFIALFDKKTWKRKKPTMKSHYGNRDSKDYDYNTHRKKQSEEVDRILDKIKKSGYNTLTTEEKKTLFDASKR